MYVTLEQVPAKQEINNVIMQSTTCRGKAARLAMENVKWT